METIAHAVRVRRPNLTWSRRGVQGSACGGRGVTYVASEGGNELYKAGKSNWTASAHHAVFVDYQEFHEQFGRVAGTKPTLSHSHTPLRNRAYDPVYKQDGPVRHELWEEQMIARIAGMDQMLFHLANGAWTTPLLDGTMAALSVSGNLGAIWLILLGLIAAFGKNACSGRCDLLLSPLRRRSLADRRGRRGRNGSWERLDRCPSGPSPLEKFRFRESR